MINKIKKSKDEWEEILPPQVFAITRSSGTEPPFRNLYWDNHNENGKYHCSNCGLTLFDGKHQFDSGTGWPSFWQPIDSEHVHDKLDPDGRRTEAMCARCGSHLGHIFEDGPAPTGSRYCMNSASLIFIPESWSDKE